MTLQNVIVINNVVCPQLSPTQAILHGRKVRICKNNKYMTRNILTGKFMSRKL